VPQRPIDHEVLEILRDLLMLAKAGQIDGLFVVAQIPRCEPQKYESWKSTDHADLVFEVRTSLWELQTDSPA